MNLKLLPGNKSNCLGKTQVNFTKDEIATLLDCNNPYEIKTLLQNILIGKSIDNLELFPQGFLEEIAYSTDNELVIAKLFKSSNVKLIINLFCNDKTQNYLKSNLFVNSILYEQLIQLENNEINIFIEYYLAIFDLSRNQFNGTDVNLLFLEKIDDKLQDHSHLYSIINDYKFENLHKSIINTRFNKDAFSILTNHHDPRVIQYLFLNQEFIKIYSNSFNDFNYWFKISQSQDPIIKKLNNGFKQIQKITRNIIIKRIASQAPKR